MAECLTFRSSELYYYCMTKEKIEQLFKAHYTKMYGLALTILYDEEESRDVVSEVFAQLITDTVVIRPGTAEHYLLTCVRNRCRNVLEHRQVRERFARLISAEMMEPVTDDPDDADRLEELLQFIDDNVAPLSQRIFRLRIIEDMTYQEVGKLLGVSKVTVHNHLVKTMEKVNAYFKSKQ